VLVTLHWPWGLALIGSALLIGRLFGSLAVTLGLAGLEAVADNEATNRKSAIAAVLLGVVAIVISLVALAFWIWLSFAMMGLAIA
jgi:hypothetical protein